MVELIIFLVILYFIFKKSGIKPTNTSNISSLLNKVLHNQQFTNTKTIYTYNGLNLITADSHGENYLFAFKNNSMYFALTELDSIYDKANKFHIHNVVIINKDSILPSSPLGKKINDYRFEVWTINKLVSLSHPTTSSNSTHTKSVLRTSNTSYDNCKIDDTPVDPIQYGKSKSHSLFGNRFQKPNRL